MEAVIRKILLMFLFGLMSSRASDSTVPIIRVIQSNQLTLNCNASTAEEKRWSFNDRPLFLNGFRVDQLRGVNLCSNYSLFFRDVSFQHQGSYECSTSTEKSMTTVVIYKVIVEVIPQLILSFDNQTFTDRSTSYVHLPGSDGEYLKIRCKAVGARPITNLTWSIEGDADRSYVNDEGSTSNLDRPNTFDSESTISIYVRSSARQVNVSCQREGGELVSRTLIINLSFLDNPTMIPPEIKIFFKDQTFTELMSSYVYLTTQAEVLNMRCEVTGSNFTANSLTWFVNGEEVDRSAATIDVAKPVKLGSGNTYRSESTLSFDTSKTHDRISCQYEASNSVRRNLTITFVYQEKPVMNTTVDVPRPAKDGTSSKADDEAFDLLLILFVCCLVLFGAFLLGLFCGKKLIHFTRGSKSEDLLTTATSMKRSSIKSGDDEFPELNVEITQSYFDSKNSTKSTNSLGYQKVFELNESDDKKIYSTIPESVYYAKQI